MTKENITKLQRLFQCADRLYEYWDKYTNKTSEPACDKYGASFNKDDRFIIFKASIFFSAHTGQYGSSSCGTFSNQIDSELAKEYFIKAINLRKEQIFSDMAQLMKEDAKSLKSAALKEIDSLQEMINSVDD